MSAGVRKAVYDDYPFGEWIDGAVDALVCAGLVDPKRVGITGFSLGGSLAYYAITHPGRTGIAAAVCSDSQGRDSTWNLISGGKPFWADTTARIDKKASSNVYRVRGATLFTLYGAPDSTHLDGIETIGAFILNRKPVDYLYFPQSDHELERPHQRLAAIQAIVDWMSFWLQGYEDPSPHKASQYARWRQIRDWEHLM